MLWLDHSLGVLHGKAVERSTFVSNRGKNLASELEAQTLVLTWLVDLSFRDSAAADIAAIYSVDLGVPETLQVWTKLDIHHFRSGHNQLGVRAYECD